MTLLPILLGGRRRTSLDVPLSLLREEEEPVWLTLHPPLREEEPVWLTLHPPLREEEPVWMTLHPPVREEAPVWMTLHPSWRRRRTRLDDTSIPLSESG